jgi:hypothetical protein
MVAEIDEELRHRAYVFPRRMQGAGLALRNRLQHRLDVMRAIKAHLEAERERVQAILNPTQTEGDAT